MKSDHSLYCVCFQRNVKEIIDANGVRTLVELLTVAHLHISRATVPMQVRTVLCIYYILSLAMVSTVFWTIISRKSSQLSLIEVDKVIMSTKVI